MRKNKPESKSRHPLFVLLPFAIRKKCVVYVSSSGEVRTRAGRERGERRGVSAILLLFISTTKTMGVHLITRFGSIDSAPSHVSVHDGFHRWGSYIRQVQLFVQLLVQLADDLDVVPPDDVQPEHSLLHPA